MNMENMKSMEIVSSDCRTVEGITIGLIDSIITISRILAKRDLESENIKSALRDLCSDEDLKYILNYLNVV